MQLTIASSVTKHTPVYNLTVRHANVSENRKSWKSFEISAPFTRWFDVDGYFIARPFQQWLASEVPIIGQADPRDIVGVSQETAEELEDTKNQITVGLEADTPGKATQTSGTSTGTRSRKSKK